MDLQIMLILCINVLKKNIKTKSKQVINAKMALIVYK